MKLLNRPKLLKVRERDKYTAFRWEYLDRAVELFARKLGKVKNVNTILALVRGGLAPAACLSHRLGKRDLVFLRGMKTGSDRPHHYKKLTVVSLPTIKKGEKVLIVEDIIFDGETVGKAIEVVRAQRGVVAGVCALVADEHFLLKKSFGDTVPFVIAYACKHLKWVRFPWERKIRTETFPVIS